MPNSFHITVGAVPQSGFNLTHELRLVKAGLLYADKVKLCSLSSALAVTLPYMSAIPDKDILALTLQAARVLNRNPESIGLFIEKYKQLQKKKFRTPQELILLQNIKQQFDNTRKEFGVVAEKLLKDANADGLFSAIKSGLVEIHSFDFQKNDAVEQYVAAIMDTVFAGESYPLLDDFTGNLIQSAIREGKIVPLGTTLLKAKQTGLSSGLFERLPLFDEATVDEIIDIRKELDDPLTRFRSAIIGFSRKIEHEPWAKEFRYEVEQVFIEHVEPAILEIEDAYRSNKFIVSLMKKVSDKPLVIPSSSAIGFLISQASNLPDVVTQSLSLAAGSAIISFEAIQEWQEKKAAIEKNQLYLYYRVKKALDS